MDVAPQSKGGLNGLKPISIEIPIRTKSEANCSESWHIKHKRHKAQQRAVAYLLNPRKPFPLPCTVTFTRLAPRRLDPHDNLPMSLKYIVDATCAIITGNYVSGQADSDPRITIRYAQETSKTYSVKIEIS